MSVLSASLLINIYDASLIIIIIKRFISDVLFISVNVVTIIINEVIKLT